MSVFVGKRKYACPTFKQNLRVSFATDVFSFGVSALVVLSGASNFEDREKLISETKLDSRQISAWARNPALFARLRKLIENCCASNPADRMSLAPVVDAVLDSLRAGPTHSETVVRGCLLLPVSVIMFSMTRSVPYADFLTVG
jgi:serine/threonine protein kinase